MFGRLLLTAMTNHRRYIWSIVSSTSDVLPLRINLKKYPVKCKQNLTGIRKGLQMLRKHLFLGCHTQRFHFRLSAKNGGHNRTADPLTHQDRRHTFGVFENSSVAMLRHQNGLLRRGSLPHTPKKI